MEITLDAAAKAFFDRWCDRLVNAPVPSHEESGFDEAREL